MTRRFHPAGSLHGGPYTTVVTPAVAAWDFAGLRILPLAAGAAHEFATGTSEVAILPLRGGAEVDVDDTRFVLLGRTGVFDAVTDFVYAPVRSRVRIASPGGGEFALCSAPARRRIAPYRVAAEDVPVEVRGGGPASRQINNFLAAGVAAADRLIAVEVLTPEGGWSSYPPHKHDENAPDEVPLEEIYYFRIDGAHGFGFFACTTSDGEIDDTVRVRDGDVYLVPRGFHGPAATAPGHHMYYLNVMAGPGPERIWRFRDDPAHAEMRAVLDALDPDPRLPLTRPRREEP